MQMEAKSKSLQELIPCLFYLDSMDKKKVIFSFLLLVSFVNNNREYEWVWERKRKGEKNEKKYWKMNPIFRKTALSSLFYSSF